MTEISWLILNLRQKLSEPGNENVHYYSLMTYKFHIGHFLTSYKTFKLLKEYPKP
jgi:hypothetical protein